MRQWQYAGSPCAPSVVWHITPDAAHRGKMPRIAIRRGTLSLHEPRPGGRLRGNSSSPEAPLRAVGRLAYHAGRCASRENGNDSDPSGNPSLHEPRPRGRFRGGGNSSERPPARRRSLGISRRMAVSQQRRLPRERFVGKEASGACFPGDENRSYCAQGTDGWAFIPRQDSPLGWVALQPRAAAHPSASRRFSRHTSRICPRPLKSQGTTSASR